ncbi:hypothetical protein [Thalassobacillus hwangdonensis]|uniref:Uncharacterized protein n=1 Tax=Thalassobacillus hwangdonensis TaxID=546108 RepID=A0ABW3KXP8_9BACI
MISQPYEIRELLNEFAGSGRFTIDISNPEGFDRRVVEDKETGVIHCVLQSDIPLVEDDALRSFLFRQLRFIHSGMYDIKSLHMFEEMMANEEDEDIAP